MSMISVAKSGHNAKVLYPADELAALACDPETGDYFLSLEAGSLMRFSAAGNRTLPHDSENSDGEALLLTRLVGLPAARVLGATYESCRLFALKDEAMTELWCRDLQSERTTRASLSIAADAGGSVFSVSAQEFLHRFGAEGEGVSVQTEDNYFWGTAISRDGSLLANGRADGTVELRNSQTLELERQLTGLTDCILSIEFSPDGRYLAASDDRAAVVFWDLASGAMSRIPGWSKAISLHWFPDSSGFAMVHLSRLISLVDTADGEETSPFSLSLPAYSPNYMQAAVMNARGNLAVFIEKTGVVEVLLVKH